MNTRIIAAPIGTPALARRARSTARRRPLLCFVTLAFALSWSWWGWLALTGQVVRAGSGWPTHFPGLLGPLLAACIVTALADGRAGVRDLLARMARWRVAPRRQLLMLAAPLAFFALGALVAAGAGSGWPRWGELGVMSGLPRVGPLGVFVALVLVNGFGEETGWRGFLLPRLQARMAPLPANLALTLVWAAWHAPLFVVLASYRGFGVLTLAGFVFGLACGALVLASVYNASGGSILVAALWHATYNLVSATDAAHGPTAAVVTIGVMLWAGQLAARELRRPRAGRAAPLAAWHAR